MNDLASVAHRLFRAGSSTRHDVQLDCILLLGIALLLIATGIGLRDPWPADEPRIALIARDMLYSGEWLIPSVGGDVYADKPPLFFWLIASFLKITASLRVAFLLPSLLAAVGCVLLVYDLARRLWGRETGLLAGLALLFTVQFIWQARQAQIDATLCFWTTLGLYGLLRHLLLGPRWGWYAVGWAAAGFGVITKGVGVLPLLVLIPFVLLRSPLWQPRSRFNRPLAWALGPLAFAVAVSTWLLPMLIASRDDAALAAYRDEILFQQTVDRYANAWHHREPFWYFIVNVIPWLWLPLTLLLPWLVPKWREALRRHDLSAALLLSWVAMVVLFFSASSGKRGVYILPALPALALASAPFLLDLVRCRAVQVTLYMVSATIGVICAGAAFYVVVNGEQRQQAIDRHGLDPLGSLMLIAICVIAVCLVARARRGIAAFCGSLASILLVVSFRVIPAMNSEQSGAQFVRHLEQVADRNRELGMVAYKEQYLLNVRRPIVNFGHARWREAEQEAFDAARWLAADAQRQLVVDANAKSTCFTNAKATPLGVANRRDWFLVEGFADADCVRRGNESAARTYSAPP